MSIQIDKVVMLLNEAYAFTLLLFQFLSCLGFQKQLQISLVKQVFIEPIWNYGVKKNDKRKRAASWYGMEEAKNVIKQQNAAPCDPLPAPSHTVSPLPL